MATWQFDICFVPENLISGKSVSADQLEDFRNLEKQKINKDSLKALVGVLAPVESWSKDLEIFGQMDGDRVDISYEDSAISEVSARIDVREVDKDFIQRLVEFAKTGGFEIVDIEKKSPIGTQARSLLAAILNSSAKTFVINPQAFPDKLTIEKH